MVYGTTRALHQAIDIAKPLRPREFDRQVIERPSNSSRERENLHISHRERALNSLSFRGSTRSLLTEVRATSGTHLRDLCRLFTSTLLVLQLDLVYGAN